MDFEPLKLIAYREHDAIGFVSFASIVNGGQEYLLGGTRLTLWSLKDSSRIHEFIDAKVKDSERLLSFDVAPDGKWCVVGDASGLLRKFNIVDRKETLSKQTDDSAVVRVAISPDGKEIATVPFVSEISIWDSETFEKKFSFKVDAREIKQLKYTAPGVLIAAGESMSSWETATGKKLSSYPSEKYQSAVGLTPDTKQLLFGSKDALTRWSLSDDKASGEYRGVPHHSAAIRFSDDGALLAIATNGAVHILDAKTGSQLQVIDASGSAVTDACWIPNSQALMVSTESAQNRIWGRVDECRKLGIDPIASPPIDISVRGNVPASVAQNLSLIDLRMLPKLPDAKPQSDSFYSVNYSTTCDTAEAADFYRYILAQRGWEYLADQSSDGMLLFSKQGYRLQLSNYTVQPKETYINLTCLGNHDLTKLPQYSAVHSKVYSGASSVIYKVKASLFKIEVELLRKFHADGWTHVVRLDSRQSEESNARHLEFVQRGTVVRVMVQPDPEDAKLMNVHYSQALTANSIPVPSDSGVMEWDDFAECQLVANTGLSIEEATKYYQTSMPEQGWTARQTGRRIDKDLVYLPFYRGQQDATVALNKLTSGLVRIRSGKYSESSWQKPELEKPTEEKATPVESNKTDVGVPGIEAADMPILHADDLPTYDSAIGLIRFKLDKTQLSEVAKEYSTAFTKLGWTAKPFGDPTEKSVDIHFEKDSIVIYYQSSIDPTGQANIRMAGEGLKWTKPISSPKPIAYAQWLRNQALPASLKTLDQFEAQMSKLEKE